MEFLVRMVLSFDHSMPPDERDRYRVAEARRARELADEGKLKRLWRVPGRRANWGIWSADDATDLHTALSSLPLWPWLDIEVLPLADHENDPIASRGSNA